MENNFNKTNYFEKNFKEAQTALNQAVFLYDNVRLHRHLGQAVSCFGRVIISFMVGIT
ncbi:hypothetical protein [Leptospira alexanderi]|uniref:hypothetical protein n=1 Tax=Leptospira alexanderi TaxID=100053 RepID=UPI001591C615|nr:hypothetical protein [Leptospira alexanderi]